MRSEIGTTFHARSMSAQTPQPPVVVGADLNAVPQTLQVQLPTLDKNGQPLTSLSQLIMSIDDGSLLEKVEGWLHLLPSVKMPVTLAEAGKTVTVVLPELKTDTDYEFLPQADA